MLDYPFFRLALIGVTIISVAAAMIGTYIISRRIASVCGGITHACFGGLGLGYFMGINPILMAGVFAIGSSLGVEFLSRRARVREDSAIAVIWALGMAIGVLFVFLTPGNVPELNSFLFGNILTVSVNDIWIFAAYTAVLIGFFAVYFKQIVVCAFDIDFARVSGLPVRFITLSMTVLVAICIVLTIRLVGIMLLMSMLSLPILAAEVFVHRFSRIMLVSVVISLLSCVAGLMLTVVVDVPASAMIVLVMVAVFALSKAVMAIRAKM